MAFRFDGFAPLINTSTLIAFKETSYPTGVNVQVRIIGFGLAFNPATGAMSGDITGLQLFDVTGGNIVQTVAIDPGLTSIIAAGASLFLQRALAVRNDIGTWLAGVEESVGHFTSLGTQFIVDQLDASGALIGQVVINGSGLLQQAVETGKVTSVQHLDAAGNPIPGRFVSYAANPVDAKVLFYALGHDDLLYNELVVGSDTISATTANTGALQHVISGGGGDDAFIATASHGGFVSYEYATSAVTVNMGTGSASGGGGFDTLTNIGGIQGSRYDDHIIGNNFPGVSTHYVGNTGDDTILGGSSDDLIAGNGSFSLDTIDGLPVPDDDILDGGAGNDTVDFSDAQSSIILTLSATGGGTVTADGVGTDLIDNFENVIGGSAGDKLTGNSVGNRLTGHDGDDRLNGRGGLDELLGGEGNDTLDGGTGADIMRGGTGNDTFYVDNAGDVVIENAGEGVDQVFADVASYILPANIGNLTFPANVESLTYRTGTGNALANVITGGHAGNTLTGLGGNDTLIGGNGVDRLNGGAGRDTLDGRGGNDNLDGGADGDTYLVGNLGDTILETVAGGGTDVVRAFVSGYVLAANVEVLSLAGSVAAGSGNAGNNWIDGNAVANAISGGGGHDTLLGYGGNDSLFGNGGNDTLNGGAGTDSLTGGLGDDTFRFVQATSQVDVIRDFVAGNASFDIIDLAGSGIASFAALQPFMSQGAGQTYVTINFGAGAVLYLQNTNLASLNAGDFRF